MHRLLYDHFAVCDHINGNGLDNRSANIRDGSGSVNSQNTRTKTKNVWDETKRSRYRASWTNADGKRCSQNFKYIPNDAASKTGKYEEAVEYAAAKKAEAIAELIAKRSVRSTSDNNEVTHARKKREQSGVTTSEKRRCYTAQWYDADGRRKNKTFTWHAGDEEMKRAQYEAAVKYRAEQNTIAILALKAKNPGADRRTWTDQGANRNKKQKLGDVE